MAYNEVSQTTRHSKRFWLVVLISTILIGGIGTPTFAALTHAKYIKISRRTATYRKTLKSNIDKKKDEVHKGKSIRRYFAYLSDFGRSTQKKATNWSRVLYRNTVRATSTPSSVLPNRIPADEAPIDTGTALEPVKAVSITADQFKSLAPVGGSMYVEGDWYCSAAATTLSYVNADQSLKSLGLFSGDCTNVNAKITGVWYAQKIGTWDPTAPLQFKIDSEHQSFGNTSNLSDTAGECDAAYYKKAGDKDVYAAQFTCDDGYKLGVRDDIQFTVYVFPKSWPETANTEYQLKTLESDGDKDGLNYHMEMMLGTDPNRADTDKDGLKDGDEYYAYLTNPLKSDTDGDGVSDKKEVQANTNPLGVGSATAEQAERWARLVSGSAPVLSNITVTQANGTATVSWTTDVKADGIINYGPTADYGTHISDYPFTKSHAISFAVTSGQIYHYALRACSTGPNVLCTSTPDATFTAN